LSKRGAKGRERGYALTEILIATAIAAGVLTAIAGGLSGVVRLNTRSAERAEQLADAKLIAARLHAGMLGDDVLTGLAGWRIERKPLSVGAQGETSPSFEIVIATFEDNDARSFEFLARTSADGR